jgi:hypothetical protein
MPLKFGFPSGVRGVETVWLPTRRAVNEASAAARINRANSCFLIARPLRSEGHLSAHLEQPRIQSYGTV